MAAVHSTPAPLLEMHGILGEILPRALRSDIPALLEVARNTRVWVSVRTIHPSDALAAAPGMPVVPETYFRAAADGRAAEFAWRAKGTLHAAVRQLRLDFLRNLGPSELSCHARLAVFKQADLANVEEEVVRHDIQFEATSIELPMMSEPAPQPEPQPPAAESTIEISVAPSDGQPLSAVRPSSALPPLPRPVPVPLTDIAESPAASVETTAAPVHEVVGEVPAAGPPLLELPREPILGSGVRSLPGNFYQDYYGFERMPFNNTPDTYFYFPTDKHQEALSRLIYAISERKGFVMISGEIGAGKSTLCRALLGQMPPTMKTALVTHTYLDSFELLQVIAEDFGLLVRGLPRHEVLHALNVFLVQQLAAGCTVCIIIDEAQNLTPEALEEVRMISNLETEQEKLVQIILLGQPNLRDTINLPELKQLRQRIAVQYHLDPLSREETFGYIQHRLVRAAPTRRLRFTKGAMAQVYRHTGGVPRLINKLCDNALLAGYTGRTYTITAAMVREGARDLDLSVVAGGLAEFLKFW